MRITSLKPAYAAAPVSQRTIHDRLNIYIFLSCIPWLYADLYWLLEYLLYDAVLE